MYLDLLFIIALASVPALSSISREQINSCSVNQWQCKDGTCIDFISKCDGVADCPDRSDETHALCRNTHCQNNQFRCTYGACVDGTAPCNGIQECADNSDELLPRCRNETEKTRSATCVLPEYPEHGSYDAFGVPNGQPGMSFEHVGMNYTCEQGYGITGMSVFVCINGRWSDTPNPKCVRLCQLKKHASVEYKCVSSETNERFRDCNEYEPIGTNVQPMCREPIYHSEQSLRHMVCLEDGEWSYTAICEPECGTVIPIGTELIINGWKAKRGELPWQAGIYTKDTSPYMQICGGTLVSTTVVISAAHCFWANDAQVPKERFAVALGKLYRKWILEADMDVQQSEIKNIHIPPHFLGRIAHYQADIAVLILEKTIAYKYHIRPICMSFDTQFEKMQLKDGNVGKVAGWGFVNDAGIISKVLEVSEVIFMDTSKCIAQTPLAFKPYITIDKICTGYANNTGVCKGYSGGGLAFPDIERTRERFYLRAIVSTADTTIDACNAYTVYAYTNIMVHEQFIKQYLTTDSLRSRECYSLK